MPLWQTSRMEPITPAPTPVYLISPAGALAPDAPVERALENLRRAGFAPKLDRAALKRRQRFAGSDDDRVAAFERAAAQDASIVMITRGGYGLTRILPRLDFKALARSRKRWVGLSDFTAFQLGMLARAKAATWAGPSLIADFGAESFEALDEITVGTFQDAMSGVLEVLGFRYGGPAGVEARGTLWGGNLSVVCSLLGTPWFPKVGGGILLFLPIQSADQNEIVRQQCQGFVRLCQFVELRGGRRLALKLVDESRNRGIRKPGLRVNICPGRQLVGRQGWHVNRHGGQLRRCRCRSPKNFHQVFRSHAGHYPTLARHARSDFQHELNRLRNCAKIITFKRKLQSLQILSCCGIEFLDSQSLEVVFR